MAKKQQLTIVQPDPCCKAMAEFVRDDPQAMHFHQGSWALNGCCGGGCFVMTGINFCPFCGKPMSPPASSTPEKPEQPRWIGTGFPVIPENG